MTATGNVVATVPPTPIVTGNGMLPSEWRLFFTQLLTRTGGSSGGGGIAGTITSSQISDATPIGIAVLTASSQADARAAIGAGTSNLTLQGVATGLLGGDAGGVYDPKTGTWAIELNPTGVEPGTYSSVTVDASGRVTAGSEGGASGINYGYALALGL